MADITEVDKALKKAIENHYLPRLIADTKIGIHGGRPTSKGPHNTAESWKLRKVDNLRYEIYNAIITDRDSKGNEYNIVELFEEGAKSHPIVPVKKKALMWERRGKKHFSKKSIHPGFVGRLFVQAIVDDPDLHKKLADETGTVMENIIIKKIKSA